MSASAPVPGLPKSSLSQAIGAFIAGFLAVLLAVVVGAMMAYALEYMGLTVTGFLTLGPWLAGVGLLGGWQQVVVSDVAGGIGWTTSAAGAPLLVTGAVVVFVAWRARGGSPLLALPAALGAAAGAALLVALSSTGATTANAAGSVTTTEGLTWWWEDGHLGTVTGAAVLIAATWLLNTVGLRWWRSGRGVALSLLVALGLVLTAAAVAGAIYLTSSTSVGLALALLYPLIGTLVLFGVAGVPVEAGLTRLSVEPYLLSTWGDSLLYGIGGAVIALVLAAIVGVIVRLVKHRSTWLGAITVTAAVGAFLAWAMSSTVVVPSALGAASTISVDPLVALGVGAILGAVTRFFAGRPKSGPAAPAPRGDEGDIEALLTQVEAGPTGQQDRS
ncbi:MAG: hypothetical protein R2720_03515 [Candidatus Nanopelagicales bacterium]